MEQTLETIEEFARTHTMRHIVTADSSMLVMAQEDAELREILLRADLITPDSAGILWAARRLGSPLQERVSGVEIVERLCERSVRSGNRIYFLGAAGGVAQRAAERMRARYPGAEIAGARDGYFTEAETGAVIKEIRACKPAMLCVALGIPKQEKWIAVHREQLNVPVLIGVGGTLDVLSGNVRRAPKWMRRVQAEWLWRVLNNPRKLSKVLLLPRFVRLVLQENRRRR